MTVEKLTSVIDAANATGASDAVHSHSSALPETPCDPSVIAAKMREYIVGIVANLSARELDESRLRPGLDDGRQRQLEEIVHRLGSKGNSFSRLSPRRCPNWQHQSNT